jgi:hypothetical protein
MNTYSKNTRRCGECWARTGGTGSLRRRKSNSNRRKERLRKARRPKTSLTSRKRQRRSNSRRRRVLNRRRRIVPNQRKVKEINQTLTMSKALCPLVLAAKCDNQTYNYFKVY